MRTVAFALVTGVSALIQTGSVAPQGAGRFPLWDGQATVAQYADRAHLPSTLVLRLGDCRAAIRRPTEVLTITGFRIMVSLSDDAR
jgi:hypothetical protein